MQVFTHGPGLQELPQARRLGARVTEGVNRLFFRQVQQVGGCHCRSVGPAGGGVVP